MLRADELGRTLLEHAFIPSRSEVRAQRIDEVHHPAKTPEQRNSSPIWRSHETREHILWNPTRDPVAMPELPQRDHPFTSVDGHSEPLRDSLRRNRMRTRETVRSDGIYQDHGVADFFTSAEPDSARPTCTLRTLEPRTSEDRISSSPSRRPRSRDMCRWRRG